MSTTCPYCNTDVKESLIEAEDGCCPECGALIGASNSFFDDEDFDEYDDDDSQDVFSEFDDDDSDDAFANDDFDDDDIFSDDDIGDEFDDEFGDEDDLV